MLDISTIVDLSDKLGIIQAVKSKLMRQPNEAADKLVLVLEEISKVYVAIEAELVRYLSLNFDPENDISEERAVLLTLEGGQLQTRVGEARGHCHKIGNIYFKYLQRWFDDVLNDAEAQMMSEVFEALSNADMDMIGVLDQQLVSWLAPLATKTLDLVDAGEYDKANQYIRKARKAVLPQRRAISKAMSDIRNLQAEFIAMSETV